MEDVTPEISEPQFLCGPEPDDIVDDDTRCVCAHVCIHRSVYV